MYLRFLFPLKAHLCACVATGVFSTHNTVGSIGVKPPRSLPLQHGIITLLHNIVYDGRWDFLKLLPNCDFGCSHKEGFKSMTDDCEIGKGSPMDERLSPNVYNIYIIHNVRKNIMSAEKRKARKDSA